MSGSVDFEKVRYWSPFFDSLVTADPSLFIPSTDAVDLLPEELPNRYAAYVNQLAGDGIDVPDALRQLRRREMARIIFRDLIGLADLTVITAELSCLADFCVERALTYAYEQCARRYGVPRDESGSPQQMAVLGMGKLGAYELNLSSDIDLILFHNSAGQTDGEKALTAQEFFLRVARRLIAVLDDASNIDRVFRVDIRLRPYGDSGPLVLHRDGMEKYYLEQGRDWERYAFIKARFLAGDAIEAEDFLNWMKPFVFRRHLDFTAIQSLREMKALLAKQVAVNAAEDDLKLGAGGIREIEFIAQAHQLIWGGRLPALQEPRLLWVLEHLSELELMSPDSVARLKSAYVFLRNSEHAIQAEQDRQTHQLPSNPESCQRLSEAMGFSEWSAYQVELERHRDEVRRCFSELIAVPNVVEGVVERGNENSSLTVWRDSWLQSEDAPIAAFRDLVQNLQLDAAVRDAVNSLVPRLLQLAADSGDKDRVIERMLPVIQSILRRSTYIVFLLENPDALRHAVELVVVSPWVAEQLKSHPILLYDLSDRSLQAVSVTRGSLAAELRELMRSVAADDAELRMDILRQFKLAATMKIAAMELTGKLSIMEASDGLTALAAVVVEAVIDMAERHLLGRHGEPCDREGKPLEKGLAVIAYGKAGGYELAYGSDLDLVFLGPDQLSGRTDGDRPVPNNTFFLRLGQRVLHMLTSFTRFGVLYDADLRLRPQGNKGPLVATLGAYGRYLREEAWTWEHQALVRARFLAGDLVLGAAFTELRQQVLAIPRDATKLRSDVLQMRETMRRHHTREGGSGGSAKKRSPHKNVEETGIEVLGAFDLKHEAGAIVDIEFMVQYAVLGGAVHYPALTRWTDVMRLLDDLEQADLLTDVEAETLQRAFLAFRAAIHYGWLGLEIDFARLQSYRQEVRHIWDTRMLADAEVRN